MTERVKPSTPVVLLLSILALFVLIPNSLNLYKDSSIWRRKSFMKSVNELAEMVSFESIHNNQQFIEFTKELREKTKPPYLIIYDSSNLEVVFNHICNLQFIPNALDRLAGISLDQAAYDNLKKSYPSIPSVIIDLELLKKTISKKEKSGYLTYTLALLTHTRIMASLALRGVDFWSMHQDTIWVKNFVELNVEDRFPDAHMIFDRIGNDDLPVYKRVNEWICAATFFVRASQLTYQFFRQTESFMLTRQSPESTILTYLCGHAKYKCERMPRWMVSSINYFKKPKEIPPFLIQIDATKKNGTTKMDLLRENDFIFRFRNGSCDGSTFSHLKESVQLAFPGERVVVEENRQENLYQRLSYKLKIIFNVDPYNTKYFLNIHNHLM